MKRFTCDAVVEVASAYLDHEIDEATERHVAGHLAGCEGCARYLDQFRATVGLLGDLPPQGLSGPTRKHLMTAFRESRRT